MSEVSWFVDIITLNIRPNGRRQSTYLLFFPSKENPDTQVRSHCSVAVVIHSGNNIGISRITCCVFQKSVADSSNYCSHLFIRELKKRQKQRQRQRHKLVEGGKIIVLRVRCIYAFWCNFLTYSTKVRR